MASMIDRGLLLKNLALLPEAKPLASPEEHSYLMEAIVAPLLNDQTVTLASLDYDRFDEKDLDSLLAYLDGVTERVERLREIIIPMEKLAPLCVSHPVFC